MYFYSVFICNKAFINFLCKSCVLLTHEKHYTPEKAAANKRGDDAFQLPFRITLILHLESPFLPVIVFTVAYGRSAIDFHRIRL